MFCCLILWKTVMGSCMDDHGRRNCCRDSCTLSKVCHVIWYNLHAYCQLLVPLHQLQLPAWCPCRCWLLMRLNCHVNGGSCSSSSHSFTPSTLLGWYSGGSTIVSVVFLIGRFYKYIDERPTYCNNFIDMKITSCRYETYWTEFENTTYTMWGN